MFNGYGDQVASMYSGMDLKKNSTYRNDHAEPTDSVCEGAGASGLPAAGDWAAAEYQSGALGLLADPVNYITHLTGYWALFLLMASLAVTPVRRLHPKLANLIRFRRMLGLYAFFYATLHLATYVFLFSGYDVPTVVGGAAGRAFGRAGGAVEIGVADHARRLEEAAVYPGWAVCVVPAVLLAVTSPAFIMRWMGGKRWRQRALAGVCCGVAGVIHYWWLVKKGVRAPMPFTLVLTVLLLARVVWTVMKRNARSGRRAAEFCDCRRLAGSSRNLVGGPAV